MNSIFYYLEKYAALALGKLNGAGTIYRESELALCREGLNIHLAPFALGEAAEGMTLFADKAGSGLGSLTKRMLDHANANFVHQESVAVIRFEDSWDRRLERRSIDFVKIDVEGHELSVLRGFGRALQKTQTIQFEFGGCNIDTRTFFRDFWYFFAEHGFSIFRIGPFSLQKIRAHREIEEFFFHHQFPGQAKFLGKGSACCKL